MPRSSVLQRRQARCVEERMRTANCCSATTCLGVTSDEGLIILGHPEQQLAGLETRAVTLFQHLRALDEGRDTVGIDELQCAALMRRETPAEDRADVGIGDGFDHAFFETLDRKSTRLNSSH